jgi:hypothetical protein
LAAALLVFVFELLFEAGGEHLVDKGVAEPLGEGELIGAYA